MLVGALLERLHMRLEGDTFSSVSVVSSGGSLGGRGATLLQQQQHQQQRLLQLPLLPFFTYEGLRSVEETARFRIGGLALLECLCLLERRHFAALQLKGGPYTRILWYAVLPLTLLLGPLLGAL